MTTPIVSVIVPAFNAAAFIGEALASLRAQTLVDIEVIVIDDASTDGTSALVEAAAAADPRIRLLRRAVNSGPSAARNQGLAAAEGRWIALLDADDSYGPDRLAHLVELGERHDAQLCSDNLALDIDGEPGDPQPMIPPAILSTPRELGLHEFVQRNVADPQWPRLNLGFLKPIFRRDFLVANAIRYDERVRFAEDYALYIDCFRAGARWWMSPAATYRYRVRADSLTQVQTVADLGILHSRLDALIRVAADDSDLVRSIERQRTVVYRCLHYRAFTDAVKDRRPGVAARELLGDPRRTAAIAQELARQAPIIVRKALRGGYRR
ncbi:glycosyltransferase [Sphingosinicellaceae bacterium]|nr:glycosyltransferase [Sphingosinicellaceae bacterium]